MTSRTYTYLTAVIGVVCGYVIVRSILFADALTVRNDLVHGVLVGDRSGLAQNPDGSVDIYLQHAAPTGPQANWLPAPAGRFNLWLRAYMPDEAILQREYIVPPVVEARRR